MNYSTRPAKKLGSASAYAYGIAHKHQPRSPPDCPFLLFLFFFSFWLFSSALAVPITQSRGRRNLYTARQQGVTDLYTHAGQICRYDCSSTNEPTTCTRSKSMGAHRYTRRETTARAPPPIFGDEDPLILCHPGIAVLLP